MMFAADADLRFSRYCCCAAICRLFSDAAAMPMLLSPIADAADFSRRLIIFFASAVYFHF